MARGFFLVLLAFVVAYASAFVPPARLARPPVQQKPLTAMAMAEETTYWEGKAPPSKVLGPFLSKIPSGVLGPASLVFLIVGSYSVHESNIFHTLTVDTINPAYVLASFLCPISWGTHVAAWIQKQNGL